MIIKIHSRGSGNGGGPIDYLLGKQRDRDKAIKLRGNETYVKELIDTCDYARTYTSGVLSFQEHDLPHHEKERLMDEFEETLMAGLDKDQYACLWVEHRDKGRLELNFVFPNIELRSGKRLQPYFDKADRPRVNAWQTLTNDRLGIRDPNDPLYRRPLTTCNDLPRDKKLAVESITRGVMESFQTGEVKTRQDVIHQLESFGFKVVRETKSSISIADPSGGKNIRLKGMIYERDFKFSEAIRENIENASQSYRGERESRIFEARECYQRGIEIKREEHQRRYSSIQSTSNITSSFNHDENQSLGDVLRTMSDGNIYRNLSVSRNADKGSIRRDSETQQESNDIAKYDRKRTIDNQGRQESKSILHSLSKRGEQRGQAVSNKIRGNGNSLSREISGNNAPKSHSEHFNLKENNIYDRDRKSAPDRIREFTERLRETAERMEIKLREFTKYVQQSFSAISTKPKGQSDIKRETEQFTSASERFNTSSREIESRITQVIRLSEIKNREQQIKKTKVKERSRGFSM